MSGVEIDVAPLKEAFDRLRDRFPESVLEATFVRKELSVKIRRTDLVEVLRFLKREAGFNALNDVVGLDNLKPPAPRGAGEAPAPAGKRFSLLYLLYRFPEGCRIRVAVDLDEGEPVDSIVPVYRAAEWAEREIFDMFGIPFAGHPDLRRVYLPDEFEGFPLRKDFPLEGKTRAE
jgi:NADH-quinone oxidoreductase subunit C